jgi:DNA-binding response OmpR family regulator
MQKAVILLVEGKRAGQYTAVPAIEKAGHHLELCHTGSAAVKAINNMTPHLIIFNAATMRTNGARTCRRLKRNKEELPIIHIRAAGEPEDLTAEADVYLEQPFTPRKLLNRVKDMLPIDHSVEETVRYGHISLYLSKKSVDIAGKGESRLTPKLAHLLEQFLRHPCRVLTRRELMQSVWKTDYIGDTRTLDVHIRWVREHIEENPANPQFLKTVRGKGYILTIPPNPAK